MTADKEHAAGPRRLLVVDDNPTLRHILRNALECFGFEVSGEAADGRQAVEAFEATRPDAVLLDIEMPDFDGFYALERIMEQAPSTVVVMLTAHRNDDLVERATRLGARGYLTKPFVMERLFEEVRLLLGLATARSAGAHWNRDYLEYVVKKRVSLPGRSGADQA